MFTVALAVWSVMAASAQEHTLELGLGAGVGMDLPDAHPTRASFGVGPTVLVPVRFNLAEHATVRATARGDAGFGSAELVTSDPAMAGQSWDARFFSLGLTAGPELRLPLGGVALGIGAEAGGALVRTDYALPDDGVFAALDRKNAAQIAVLSDVHLGVTGGGSVGWFAELGYSLAWLDGKELGATPQVYQSSWGWNAPRIAGGVRIGL